MFDFSCNFAGKRVHRVTKRVARRLFEQGLEVILSPCNMRPDSAWGLGYSIQKGNWGTDKGFDYTVDMFEVYNCNRETGLYAAYYV